MSDRPMPEGTDEATPPDEAELEAERRGTTAEEVVEEEQEDEATPLDVAYRPRSG